MAAQEKISAERLGGFISLEGADGCGKSTQLALLSKYLKDNNYAFSQGREPGGTKVGEEIRRLLLSRMDFKINDVAEVFLFQASRVHYVADLVIPALLNGEIFLSDRFYDSSIAYQGYAGGVNLDFIKHIISYATFGLSPHLTLLFDVDLETSLEAIANRQGGDRDRIEVKESDYHRRVIRGFRRISETYPDRVKVVPYVSNNPQAMHERAVSYVEDFLSTRNVNKKK